MSNSYLLGGRPSEARPMATTAAGANLEDGWVAFVGAGPGDDGLMTMRGARLLGGASIVIAEAEVAAGTPWPRPRTPRARPGR
jgi:hypothetical protein